MNDERIVQLLEEIRDNQRAVLEYNQKTTAKYEAAQAAFAKRGGFVLVLVTVLIVVIIVYFLISIGSVTCRNANRSGSAWKVFSSAAKLEIVTHEARPGKDHLAIVGTIRNDGSDSWNSIALEVELFDAADRFLDQCETYLPGAVAPQEERNFKVLCTGPDAGGPPKYSRYTVRVQDAIYVAPTQQ